MNIVFIHLKSHLFLYRYSLFSKQRGSAARTELQKLLDLSIVALSNLSAFLGNFFNREGLFDFKKRVLVGFLEDV